MTAWRYLGRVGAAMLAASVAMLVVSTAAERRASVVDAFQPAAPRGDDVVVVALGPAFTSRAELDLVTAYTPLITNLAAAEASVVVIEPDVLQLAQTRLALLGEGNSTSLVDAALQTLGNAVTASVVGDLEEGGDGRPRVGRPIPRTPIAEKSLATGFATPVPLEAAQPQRTLPLVAEAPDGGDGARDTVVPSLPLAAVLASDGSTSPELQVEGRSLTVGGRQVRTEPGWRLRVSFARELLPGGSGVIDGGELADGTVDPSLLRDKVVFVGITDPLYAQLFPAAAGGSGQLPVVYTDANAANTILTEAFVAAPSTRDGVVLGLVLGVVVALVVLVAPFWVSPMPIGLALVGLWFLERSRLGEGEPFDLLLSWFGVLAAGVVALVWRIVDVARARRRTASLFARYVPSSVATQLMEGGRAEELAAGREHDITVLFIDLRGFTPLSRQLEPPQIRRLLDHFYEYVCARVQAEDGTIMQFVGDEVFAVFGAPIDRPDHAAVAIAVALRLQHDVDQLDATLAADGLPPVRFGVGVNSGLAVAAHVGTAARSQYTILGDTVNTAARLVSIAAADQVIASAATVDSTENPDLRPVGQVDLKGIDVPVTIYQYGPGEPRGTITTAATLSP